ncbi:MAG: phytoene/squalene synthase family protein [Rickettsiales bacterium]|nr:phytoene/squalene synthase family protein [Pseudomonadota bacterium]MDA0965536.1 phytoene/squalene synthase family protein [Pseudomonadota bacterium]MDG4542860.1 phytoene/squalene synthase family protein [Rickettsiales bacterium]MDG4544692.1 phytoene/squalene synthase family protein [Rickettsiales bacterium]MDG4546814.1 phytoene/squalene synthase family protein [Rickettsiales bacterium]
MVAALPFCENEVKKHDYERYLCCLLADCRVRNRLFAIYAFNNEIAKIKHIVSEPMAGYIRLQWWRDAIDEIYTRQPIKHRHETVDALYEVVRETGVGKELFDNLIDAREADIDFKTPKDIDSLGEYAIGTSSNLFYLLLAVADVNCNTAKEAAYHAGIAFAITGFMRSMKYNAYYGRLMLPQDMMKKQGITVDDILRGEGVEKTKPIVRALCDKAEVNLHHTKTLLQGTTDAAKSVLLPVCIVDVFLKRIKKCDYDLFNSNIEGNIFSIQMKIYLSKLLKRV